MTIYMDYTAQAEKNEVFRKNVLKSDKIKLMKTLNISYADAERLIHYCFILELNEEMKNS